MILTVDYIKRRFVEFNELMFNGELPEIPISLTDAKGFVGVCRFNIRQTDNGKTECYDFSLSFNTRLELPENEIEDTIIHEMIHYFIGYKQLEDATAHGPVFQTMMNLINEKFGRHISITHKTTAEQQEQLISKRRTWHIVAIVAFTDGSHGVKVLPRIIQRVLEFDMASQKNNEISQVSYYMTDEPYFNRYPASSSAWISIVDESEYKPHLASAHKLVIDGNDLREE